MIEKKDILKMAKHVFKHSKGQRSHELMHPKRDWSIGVILAGIVLVAGGVYAAYTYNTYANIDVGGGVSDTTVTTYKREQVIDAIDLFAKREAAFDAIAAVELDPVPEEEVLAPVSSTTASTTESQVSEDPDITNPVTESEGEDGTPIESFNEVAN